MDKLPDDIIPKLSLFFNNNDRRGLSRTAKRFQHVMVNTLPFQEKFTIDNQVLNVIKKNKDMMHTCRHWAARKVMIESSAAKTFTGSNLQMLFDIGCIHSHTESLDLTGCDKINDLTVLNDLSALDDSLCWKITPEMPVCYICYTLYSGLPLKYSINMIREDLWCF